MKVKSMLLSDIKPYAKNPRINESAVEKVAQSLKEFGIQQPIVVDKKNVIIVGHTRRLAAIELGLKKFDVIVADKLTPKQIKAYRIADNRVGEEAQWDVNLLKHEIGSLGNYDLDILGFNDKELEKLLKIDLDDDSPDEFRNYDEDIETEFQCPKCNYEWSGKPK